jgi:hypothetical protein
MYDDKSISSFLDGVLSGKHGTSSFQDLPQVRRRVPAVCRFGVINFDRAAQQADVQ